MIENFETKDLITITISLIALFIAILNWIRDWRRISVTIEKKEILQRVETFDCVPAYPNQSPGTGVQFRFLNSSKHSIGYFDIVFRDAYTNELLSSFFTYALRPEIANQELLGITLDNKIVHLNPMQSNYGMIPPNSFKSYESIVYPKSDKIRVNIKFAKFTLLRNRFSETHRFSKWKSVVISLSDEEVKFYEQNLWLTKE